MVYIGDYEVDNCTIHDRGQYDNTYKLYNIHLELL